MVKAAEPAAETPEGGAQKEAGWGEFLQSNSSQLAILSVGMAYMLTWASDSGKARGWGAKDASGTRAFGVGAALGAAAPQPSLVCAVQTLFWFLSSCVARALRTCLAPGVRPSLSAAPCEYEYVAVRVRCTREAATAAAGLWLTRPRGWSSHCTNAALLNAPVALAAVLAAARLVSRAERIEQLHVSAASAARAAEKRAVAAETTLKVEQAGGGNARRIRDAEAETRARQAAAWQDTMASEVADEVERLVAAVVDEFIRNLWWRQCTPDTAFPREMEKLLAQIVAELLARVREVDMAALVLRDVVAVTGAQLDVFRQARDVALGPPELAASVDMPDEERSRRIQRALQAGGSLHVAIQSPAATHAYHAHIADTIAALCLPSQEGGIRALRVLARELLATCVLQPAMSYFNPDHMNVLVANVLRSYEQNKAAAAKKGEARPVHPRAAALRERPGHRRNLSDPTILRQASGRGRPDLGTLSLSAVLGTPDSGGEARPRRNSDEGPKSPIKAPSPDAMDRMMTRSVPAMRSLDAETAAAADAQSPSDTAHPMSQSVPVLPSTPEIGEYVLVGEDEDPLRGGGGAASASASGESGSSAAAHGSDAGGAESDGGGHEECVVDEEPPALTGRALQLAFSEGQVTATIQSSVMREETGVRMLQKPEYVAYIIALRARGVGWTVERRFRQFEVLHRRLRDVPGYDGQLPPKRGMPGFGGPSGKAITVARRYLLEAYIIELVSSPHLRGQAAVREFLTRSHEYDGEEDVLDQLLNPLLGKPAATPSAMRRISRTRSEALPRSASRSFSRPASGSFTSHPVGGLSAAFGSPVERVPVSPASAASSVVSTPLAGTTPWGSFTDMGSKLLDGDEGMTYRMASAPAGQVAAVEPASEAGATVVSASRSLDPLFVLTEGLYDFAGVLFNLRKRGWLRRQVLWIAKQFFELLAGEAMEDALAKGINTLASSETRALLIRTLRESIWPGGVWYGLVPGAKERYAKTVAESKEAVRELLLGEPRVAEALVNLVGARHYRRGLADLHQALQTEAFLRQLGFSLVEVLLCHIFPELDKVVDAAKEEAADVLRREQAEER